MSPKTQSKKLNDKWLEPVKLWSSAEDLISSGQELLDKELKRRLGRHIGGQPGEAHHLMAALEKELAKVVPAEYMTTKAWWWWARRSSQPGPIKYLYLEHQGYRIGGGSAVWLERVKEDVGGGWAKQELENFLGETIPGKDWANGLTSFTYTEAIEQGWLKLGRVNHEYLKKQIDAGINTGMKGVGLSMSELSTAAMFLLADEDTTEEELREISALLIKIPAASHLAQNILKHPNCGDGALAYICQQDWDGAIVGWISESPKTKTEHLEQLVAQELLRPKPTWPIWVNLAKRPEARWRELGIKHLALYYPSMLKTLTNPTTSILEGVDPGIIKPILGSSSRDIREWAIKEIGKLSPERSAKRRG